MLGETKPNIVKNTVMVNDSNEKFKEVENEIHMMKHN